MDTDGIESPFGKDFIKSINEVDSYVNSVEVRSKLKDLVRNFITNSVYKFPNGSQVRSNYYDMNHVCGRKADEDDTRAIDPRNWRNMHEIMTLKTLKVFAKQGVAVAAEMLKSYNDKSDSTPVDIQAYSEEFKEFNVANIYMVDQEEYSSTIKQITNINEPTDDKPEINIPETYQTRQEDIPEGLIMKLYDVIPRDILLPTVTNVDNGGEDEDDEEDEEKEKDDSEDDEENEQKKTRLEE